MWKLVDKNGMVMQLDSGEPNSNGLESGWRWEKIERDEFNRLLETFTPRSDNVSLPDPPHEQLKKIKLHHEALIEVLEEVHQKGIQLRTGELKAMIETKLKGGT
jgi:hypothetical protein